MNQSEPAPKSQVIGMVILLGLGFATLGIHLKNESTPKTISDIKKEMSSNNEYDGSVYHVERYLKLNLKDPSSYEAIEWSPVQKLSDGNFLVRHKYRAKNSFGALVIQNQVFRYDKEGKVYSVSDY